MDAIAGAHGVEYSLCPGFSAAAAPCTPALADRLEIAARETGIATMRLPSGAGHDAMSMALLCPIAMLFVRCLGGISHHPAESITPDDAGQAVDVLVRALRDFVPGSAA
jgi:allantoate deiminase